jgi:hypothetical protein
MATLVDLVTTHARHHLAPADLANCAACDRDCRNAIAPTLTQLRTAVQDIRTHIRAVDDDYHPEHWDDNRHVHQDDYAFDDDYIIAESSTIDLFNSPSHLCTRNFTANSIAEFAKQPLTDLHIRKYYSLEYQSGVKEYYSLVYTHTPLALARSLRTMCSQ